MNYIELINRFWAFNEEVSFPATDVALYFYLLKVSNACSWKVMFRRNNYKIMADLSIRSPKTLAESRNRLKQAGLIDFQTKNGSAEVTYSLTSVKNTEVDAEVSAEVGGEVTSRLGRGSCRVNINRNLNKNTSPPLSPVPGEAGIPEAEEGDPIPDPAPTDPPPAPPEGKRKSCAKKKNQLDLSFIEPAFQPIMTDWLAYKSERGQAYRQQGMKACYTRLRILSQNDPQTARSIISQSMSNNWAGFYPLKQSSNHDPRTTNSRTLPDNPVYRSDNDQF